MDKLIFLTRGAAAGLRKILGVSWNKGSSPTMTRTDSAVGMVAGVGALGGAAVANSFDNAPIYREITEVTDGLGNTFVRIPKFYIAKTDGVDYHTIRISKTQHAGFYLPAVFWDFANGRELPYYDHGKYKASLEAGNKLGSKSGVYPLVNKTIVDFRTYARSNGTGYQQLDVHAQDVIATLFAVEFATLASQAIMPGFTSGPWDATHTATVTENAVNRIIIANAKADTYRVGQTTGIGTTQGGNQVATNRLVTAIATYDASNKAISFDGAPVNIAIGNIVYSTGWLNGFATGPVSGYLTANDGKYPCSYRGIESPWGDVWQFVDGININDRQAWVTTNEANYASNVFAAPYVQLGYANAAADGYVKSMGFDAASPFAEFPTVAAGGASNTYYGDYYYQNTGQRIAFVGGYWGNGSDAGLRYWSLNSASSAASVTLGGRLLRKPL